MHRRSPIPLPLSSPPRHLCGIPGPPPPRRRFQPASLGGPALPSLSRPRRRALQGVGPPTPRPPRPHRGGSMRAGRPPLATRSHGGRVEHSRKRRKNRRVGASALSPCLFLGARRRTRAVVFSRFPANQLELTHMRFAWLVVSAVCVPGPGGRRTSPSKDTTWHLCADLVWPCAPSSRAQYHNPSPKTARGHTGKVPRR